jgi:hypothetical protein
MKPKKKQGNSSQRFLIRFSRNISAIGIQIGEAPRYVLLVVNGRVGKKWMPDIMSVEDISELDGTKKMSIRNARDVIYLPEADPMNTLLSSFRDIKAEYWNILMGKKEKKSQPKKLKK